MPSEIIKLLEEAQAGAPPLRYDADYVWLAGRRRRRRRNAGWAIAAVVAVAAAIGVPQIATHSAERGLEPVAPAGPVPEFTYRGYDVGRFHVTGPQRWDLGSQVSEIRVGSKPVGRLEVLHAGVRRPDPEHYERVQTANINGRPAYFLAEHNKVSRLRFEYGDDARAEIALDDTDRRAEQLRLLAEAFRPTTPYPVTVALSSREIPAGYQLIRIMSSIDGKTTSEALFFPADKAQAILDDPSRQLPAVPGKFEYSGDFLFRVTLENRARLALGGPERDEPGCTPPATSPQAGPATCVVGVSGGKWLLEATGPKGAEAEVRKVIDATTQVTDPSNAADWIPVERAFPAPVLATMRKM